MRADVPFNRLSSSPSANNPTSSPPSRAQNRRGCFSRPSHLCQAEIHSQERNGVALVALKSACHSDANNDNASAPLCSSTTNLLTSTPPHSRLLIFLSPRGSARQCRTLCLCRQPQLFYKGWSAQDGNLLRPGRRIPPD